MTGPGPSWQPSGGAADIRQAGPDLLSLSLMDARNRLLALLHARPDAAALRTAVRVARFQEHWIGCHLQRQRGEACDPGAPRLAGIEPQAEAWAADGASLPTLDTVLSYLAQTLEVTLDLLAAAPLLADAVGGTSSSQRQRPGAKPAAAGPDADAAWHVYRAALWHEDRCAEQLAEAQGAGVPTARSPRQPLQVAAGRCQVGSAPGGYVPHTERWAHQVAVPAFEIDALPVSWAAYAPFAEDGGYDRREFWTDAGWAWVQRHQRRAPRGVEQFAGGVLLRRGAGGEGAVQRAAAMQPALHLSRFEAEAWCRWAGRRLPTEPEWERAACTLGSGFVWGDVYEWVAGSARLWPNAGKAPPGDPSAAIEAAADDAGATPPGTPPSDAPTAVMRGASCSTPPRWHHPRARRFTRADQDQAACGFRSCAT